MGQPRLIDRVKDHFDAGLRKIEVPEWGDDDGPAIIYSTPLTLSEKRTINTMSRGDEFEGICRVLILKAMDSEGKKLFSIEDMRALMKSGDADVISTIVQQMAGGADVSDEEAAVEDAEKK